MTGASVKEPSTAVWLRSRVVLFYFCRSGLARLASVSVWLPYWRTGSNGSAAGCFAPVSRLSALSSFSVLSGQFIYKLYTFPDNIVPDNIYLVVLVYAGVPPCNQVSSIAIHLLRIPKPVEREIIRGTITTANGTNTRRRIINEVCAVFFRMRVRIDIIQWEFAVWRHIFIPLSCVASYGVHRIFLYFYVA